MKYMLAKLDKLNDLSGEMKNCLDFLLFKIVKGMNWHKIIRLTIYRSFK